jgi:RND family efflux transporter MFP subunit
MQLYAGLSTAAIVVLAIAVAWLAVSLRQAEVTIAGLREGAQQPQQDGGAPPSLVRVDLARVETVQRKRLVTGQIEAVQQSTVAAEESGLVIQAPPEQGTAVKKGDVLARLDPQLLETSRLVAEAQLNEAKASVSQAEATYDEADGLVARYKSLIDEGAITQVDFDRAVRDRNVAKAQVATAKAAVESRKAEVQRIDIQLKKMTVRAPFDGYVITKHAELGQWLAPGGAVAELVSIQQVDAILEVPETMIDAVDPAATVDVSIPGIGRTVGGKVFREVPNADREARTVEVLIRLDNADGAIKPGMSAQAELPMGEQIQALTIPRSAVKTTPLGLQVWINRGGTAVPSGVVAKFMVGDRMVIEGNLADGDQVVIEGNERLHPGATLNVQNAEEFAAKPQEAPQDNQATP